MNAGVKTLVVLGAALVLSCGGGDSPISGKVPDLTLKTLEKKSVKLSDYGGKLTLLAFWATWCYPCIIEIPSLIALESKYRKQGFQVVALNVDDPQGDLVKKLAEEHGINYTLLLGDDNALIQFGGVEALPTSFLINKDGQIIEKLEGLIPEYIMDAKIRRLLPPAS